MMSSDSEKKDPLEGLGARIRQIRGDLSLKAFAGKLGSAASYLSELENDQKRPGAELLAKIYQEFDCNLQWLLTGDTRFRRDIVAKAYVLAQELMVVPKIPVEDQGRLVALIADLLQRGRSEAQVRELAAEWAEGMEWTRGGSPRPERPETP